MKKNRNQSCIVKTLKLSPQHFSSSEDDFCGDYEEDVNSFDIDLPDDDSDDETL